MLLCQIIINCNNVNLFEEIDNTPIARQVYITSSNDVTITHGLILNSSAISANAIPVTNRTPQGLTYGGSLKYVTHKRIMARVVRLCSLCNQAQRIIKILLLVFCQQMPMDKRLQRLTAQMV
jgi:hypothetical protein